MYIQQKHPVIYRIGYSFRALWTQIMYENIVICCVIFSKMSFENGNMFYTNVHTCGKCQLHLKQKQFSDERFWKQTLLR